MNDREPLDGHDPHLSERMERAVGGLRAPDVVPAAIARGRRQRTHRRLLQGAGGLAAATALVLSVPAFAGSWTGQDPSGPPVASDPAATSPPTAAPGTDGSTDDPCGDAATGWWSKSSAQIEADLSALLPDGIRIGETNDDWSGTWGGNLVTGDDADFASLTLVPPPGTPGGRMTLADVAAGARCSTEGSGSMQAVKPCDELSGHTACEEIRSEDGSLVGVVTEKTEQTIVNGEEEPTDRTYVLATIAVPGGGQVELYVAEGTRADRPDTVHDPADVPALTMDQVREIVTDPVWTS
ncbi:MAG: hypothetical protein JWO76_946 [Nocardioides sp.]|nr:hypothetical protein [Nocardioides sp.]